MPQPCAPLSQAGPELPPSLSPQAVRPLKNFLQGQGGGIKDFIKRNTSTRPNLKVGCVQGGEENGRRMCWEGEFWCLFQTFNRVFYVLSLQGDFVVSMTPYPWGWTR